MDVKKLNCCLEMREVTRAFMQDFWRRGLDLNLASVCFLVAIESIADIQGCDRKTYMTVLANSYMEENENATSDEEKVEAIKDLFPDCWKDVVLYMKSGRRTIK